MFQLVPVDTQILCRIYHVNLFTNATSSVYNLYGLRLVLKLYGWLLKSDSSIVTSTRGV